MNPYRIRTWSCISELLRGVNSPCDILDFGAGDGWFAEQIKSLMPEAGVVAVDVVARENSLLVPIIYKPKDPLPFADNSFDLSYAIDVLHHCHSPSFYLQELMRVSRRYILIKDHICRGWLDFFMLFLLDELGNRRFGIPSPGNYQRNWQWGKFLEKNGWQQVSLVYPCESHSGLLGIVTNHLQYIALYECNK
jgi:SAM-dependent methyltransferase